MIKTRFSPSPTGNVHLGNIRTALFSLLYIMNKRGTCVLRVEDTDQERSDIRYIRLLFGDLNWLGILQRYIYSKKNSLGARSPQILFQSNRGHIYRSYCSELLKKSFAYFCFCTKEKLDKERKQQILDKVAPRYSGTCRYLTKAKIIEKIASGLSPAIRYLVPDNKVISFYDMKKGVLKFNSGNISDFIILKNDLHPTFLLCNLIDDSLNNISHIVRGEDHITNTACQEIVSGSFNFKRSCYLHLPLFLEKTGIPFSKRNNSFSIRYLRESGYLPTAIINYLVQSGNLYQGTSPITLDKLAEVISMKSISRSSSVFKECQMIQWQKRSVEDLNELEFFFWSGKKVMKSVPVNFRSVFFEAIRGNVLFPRDVEFWADCLFSNDFLPNRILLKNFNLNTALLLEEIKNLLLNKLDLDTLVECIRNKFELKKKIALMCIRIALTGRKSGPGIKIILKLLDKRKINKRLSCENLR